MTLPVNWFDFGGGAVEFFLGTVFGVVGLTVLLYSIYRVRAAAGQLAEYYAFVVLLTACGIGIVYAGNLLVGFVLWELSGFAIWRLVLFYRRDESADAAAWTWYINFAASAVMLVGLALVFEQHRTLSFAGLAGRTIELLPAVLLLTGIIAKSAVLPLYVWLPRAYRAAPAPICALLSGVAESVGGVMFFKLFVTGMRAADGFLPFVAALAVISSLIAGGAALASRSIRTTLAYSTMGQMGLVILGLATVSYYGVIGALLYLATHALAKSGLFYAFGLVEEATGRNELSKLGRVAQHSPVLAVITALLTLTVVGIPPSFGFFGKVGILIGAVDRGLVFGVGAIVAALLTLVYMTRLYTGVFLGGGPADFEWQSPPTMPIIAVAVIALIVFAGGFLYAVPVNWLEIGLGVGGH